MIQLLEDKNIEVSDLEIKKENTSYTVDTLNALKNQCPKDDFIWIIGEDQLRDFKRWKNWQEIIEKFGVIIVPRQVRPPRGSPTVTPEVKKRFATPPRWRGKRPRLLGGELRKITILDQKTLKPLNISSSEIRRRIKMGKDIEGLVPKEVERYIIKHKLYT